MKFFILLLGLTYFVDGKPCPEKTKAHTTKCDAFFKCIELSPTSHAWVPEKCERGLIYEQNLKMCVLPEDDWECNLGEISLTNDVQNNADDEIIVYGVGFGLTDIKNTNNILDSNLTETNITDFEGTEFSGDGEPLDLTTSMPFPEIKKMSEDASSMIIPQSTSSESTPKYDPKLTANLQRLSQLITGLKHTYQNKKNGASELQPHQLNAFLAHFNIKSKFDSLLTNVENNHNDKISMTKVSEKTNETNSNIQVDLSPETKNILNNLISKRNRVKGYNGYSNSQVLVNRPDGSFIVTIPSHAVHQGGQENSDYVPKISDETLKTVFELSKQMLANQNVPHMIPNPAYHQPAYMSTSYSNTPFSDYAPTSFSNEPVKTTSSTYFIPNGKKPTTIIHNNVIPLHLSTNNGEKDIIDSYGSSLVKYPSIGDAYAASDRNYQIAYNKRVSNRYENNKFVPGRPTQSHQPLTEFTNKKPHVKPFKHHPSPNMVAEFHTPSPHLDESNANMVFQSNQYPAIQYGSIPRPININKYESPFKYKYQEQHQQHVEETESERPNYLYQEQFTIFPSLIDHSKVKIRPNSHKVESVELEGEDDGFNEDTNSLSSNQQVVDNQPIRYFINRDKILKNQPRPAQQSQLQGGNNKFTSWSQPQRPQDPLLVNLNGNYFSYDVFKNSVLPLVSNINSLDESKVEVIKCTPGIRHPNTTDCTRYYVCSQMDGKVHSFSCPPNTAFSPQSLICDRTSHSICQHPENIVGRYTANHNKITEYEVSAALEDARRKQQQASKPILHLLHNDFVGDRVTDNEDKISEEKFNGNAINSSDQSLTSSETLHTVSAGSKRRKYYCKEGDHIPDQTSIYSYFVCYKNENGSMKGQKMNCPSGLIFCAKASLCKFLENCF